MDAVSIHHRQSHSTYWSNKRVNHPFALVQMCCKTTASISAININLIDQAASKALILNNIERRSWHICERMKGFLILVSVVLSVLVCVHADASAIDNETK